MDVAAEDKIGDRAAARQIDFHPADTDRVQINGLHAAVVAPIFDRHAADQIAD